MRYAHPSNITKELIAKDPQLKLLFNQPKTIEVTYESDAFIALVSSIVSQQLSTKVARIIFKRLEDLCDQEITTDKLLVFDEATLKAIGLSNQKVSYVKSLASAIEARLVKLDEIDQLTDEEIIDMLIQVKGIGVWTAHMFLMFSCGREDVFSVKDLGLRNAVKQIYQNPILTDNEIEDIARKWSPYRSVVSHFLWHLYDEDSK